MHAVGGCSPHSSQASGDLLGVSGSVGFSGLFGFSGFLGSSRYLRIPPDLLMPMWHRSARPRQQSSAWANLVHS
eukprot:2449317-Pyramimonas_sp.AAC.1